MSFTRVSFLAGHMPDLPPPPRVGPPDTDPEPALMRASRPSRLRSFVGWMNPAGTMIALRRSEETYGRGYLWVFLCRLCGEECLRAPHRVRAGDIQSCGCGKRGGLVGVGAPDKRAQLMARCGNGRAVNGVSQGASRGT